MIEYNTVILFKSEPMLNCQNADIPDKPTITSFGEQEHGMTLNLTCKTPDAKPADNLTYTWMKNGTVLTVGNSDTYVLSPLHLTMDDGMYTCSVSNLVGEGETSAETDVYVKCKYINC